MWMTIADAAEYLKVSKETMYRLVQHGFIPGSKLGNQWRFNREHIDEWLKEQGEQRWKATEPHSRMHVKRSAK